MSVVLAVAFLQGCGGPSRSHRLLSLVDSAFPHSRPDQVRLTGEPYRPFIETRGKDPAHESDAALRRAELEILTAASEKETPETLFALGRLYLAKNDHKKAIETLDRAAVLSADDPRLVSDLGAAYLAILGNEIDSDTELRHAVIAIEHFDTAIRLAPEMAEPRFNLALAMTTLKLRGESVNAWKAYLQFDDGSEWANEGRSTLSTIESAPASPESVDLRLRKFIDETKRGNKGPAFEILSSNREMITGNLLPQQLALRICDAPGGSAEEAEFRNALDAAANLEFENTGDPFWNDAVRHYGRSSDQDRMNICAGHRLVFAGYDKALRNDYANAYTDFAQANELYRKAESETDVLIAQYWLGYLDQQSISIAAADRKLREANAIAENKGYVWISSHFIAWLAQIDLHRDQPAERIKTAERALRLAERIKDKYQMMRCRDILASSYMALANSDRAAENVVEAMKLFGQDSTSPRQRWRSLSIAADLLTGIGGTAAVKAFINESLTLNQTLISENGYEYYGRIQLAQVEAMRGDFANANESINASRRSLSGFDDTTRNRHSNYLELVNAHILRQSGRCQDAVPIYENAIITLENTESDLDRFDARRGMLFCQIAQRDDAKIAVNAPLVLNELERYRKDIRNESLRNGFFGSAQQIFDALIRYEFGRGEAERAFDYAEMSRARSLLDHVLNGGDPTRRRSGDGPNSAANLTKPIDLTGVRSRLSDDTQLLVYSMLDDRVVIWVVKKGSFEMRSVEVEGQRLEAMINEFVASLSTPGQRSVAATELTKLLIEPVRTLLEPASTLVIIPDKEIARIPFAALPRSDAIGFLIEEFVIQYSPSASIFVRDERGESQAPMSETILAIGDPAFDSAKFPNISRLPDAREEIDTIAQLFSESVVLTGEDATAAKIGQHISQTEVLHFAGHYIYNSSSQMDSGFLIAGTGSGALLADSGLVGTNGHKIRLAVLSACSTATGEIIDGEGMLGAARSLIAAGIPQVVATHWEIDSKASAKLMIDFHRFRKQDRMQTADALRKAQLAMLSSTDERNRDPYFWAGFFAILGS